MPQEYGYGSGVTAWRRLRDWQKAGVWDDLHQRLLEKLNAAGAIDWSRAAVDGSHVRALWGLLTGPSPVDRSRTESKHHLLVDATGIPLAVALTGGHRNDVTQLVPLLDALVWRSSRWPRTRTRELVRVLALADDRPAALVVAAALGERLRRELGVPLSAETRALVEDVKRGRVRPVPAATAAPAPPALPAPLARTSRPEGRESAPARVTAAWTDAGSGAGGSRG